VRPDSVIPLELLLEAQVNDHPQLQEILARRSKSVKMHFLPKL
jgi:hypothetical protein